MTYAEQLLAEGRAEGEAIVICMHTNQVRSRDSAPVRHQLEKRQMFRRFVWKALGIDQLEKRVDRIDSRVDITETQCAMMLRHFGRYKHRTKRELKLMRAQIQDLIVTCEALVERSESEEAIKRAKALLRKLRYNDTKIQNAQEKGGMDVALKGTG